MEEPTDEASDFEYEETQDSEIQDQSSVAVAPSPVLNGRSARAPMAPPLVPPVGAKVSYTQPVNPNALMGRINNRTLYAEKQRDKDDRDYLDSFNLKAEAVEYQLSCTRTLPQLNADGEIVPTGMASRITIPVMTYDDLYQTVCDAWGGGAYRVVFCDEAGRRTNEPALQRCILINIPTTQFAPKRIQGEKIEPTSRGGKTPAVDNASEAEIVRQREMKEMDAEERRQDREDKIEEARSKREIAKLRREKEMAALRAEIMSPKQPTTVAPELLVIEKRLADEKHEREMAAKAFEAAEQRREDRRETERKEEQRRHEESLKEMQKRADDDRKFMMDSMAKLGESIREVASRPPPVKDDSMEKLFATMAPVLTAVITRPQLPPPDNKEVFLALSEGQKSNTQMLVTALTAKQGDGSEKMADMMMKLATKENSVQAEMMKGLMQTALSKDSGQLEMMLKLQDITEKRYERMSGMNQNLPGHAEEGEDGYDPALGFLGNTSKALFSGIKSLVEAAATNPQLAELALKLVGTRNPTPQQMAQAAYQVEHSVPPGIATYQQQALPNPAAYAPMDQQAIPYPPQQPPQQQQRAMPPPMPVQNQTQPPQQSATQQQSIVNELEGESSGLPSNGDPEPEKQYTPEELAEENLRDAVTRTVEVMIGEAIGKPAVRTWPEDARDHWNKDFIQKLVECHDNRMRIQMVGSKCDQQVAVRLNQIWNNGEEGRTEQAIFWREFARFVEMNRKPVVVQAPPMPAPAPVQPPASIQ